MPIGPDATFMEKWNDEAQDEFRQMKSLVYDTVTIRQKKAKTLNVPVWEQTEADFGRARNQQLNISAQNSRNVQITPELVYKLFMIDDFDQAKTDYDYRQDLSRQAAAAVWRGFDDLVIAALNESTNLVAPGSLNNTFPYEGAEAMSKFLDQQEVFESERYGLISSGAKSDLRNDTTYINNFHAPNDVVQKGMLTDVAGFDLVTSQRLPNGVPGTSRRIFAYHKMAVMAHINAPFKLTVDWENTYQSWSVAATLGANAAIVQQKGVCHADILEN